MQDRRARAGATAVALVATGGFAGATLRYGIAGAVDGLAGTLVANGLGSVALDVVLVGVARSGLVGERARLAAATGFASSLTTYSTFAVESVLVEPPLAVAYVVTTYALGFGGVLAGGALARAALAGADAGVRG